MLKIKIIVRGMVLMAIVVLCLAPWNRTAGQNDKVNSGVFEWVRSYYGPEYPDGAAANEIFGSVMDREGNIYILGQFIGNARWDDERSIMPISAHRNRIGVVAKLDREGERVWQGELYSSYGDFDVYGMRRVGDTAVMLFVEFRYPFEWGNTKNEVYYWDTLLTTKERFPESTDSLESPTGYYAFITIGMGSGKIIEEHFWIPTFVRDDGRLLREGGSGHLMTNVGERVSFNVDSEGNIILARQANDCFGDMCDTCRDGIYRWSTQEGNIIGMRLLVDGATKQLDVPLEPSSRWNWQIVKLSPHMDSVIGSTYVFDSTWRYSYEENISVYLNAVDVDDNDNVYILLDRIQEPVERWRVKNSERLEMEWYSCMIRYDSELTPTGIAQVTASYSPDGYCAGYVRLLGTYYDRVTNSLFINGTSGREPRYTTLNYRGDTLDLKNNACWLRLDADDLSLIAYGKARSTGTEDWERTFLYTDKYAWSHNGSFAVGGNRVFCQVLYQCNILFHDSQINNLYGMGLMVWDYDGHELEYIDYNSESSKNEQGYIFLKDSSLWLTGTLTANAEFGDHNIYAGWNSHAYVARYTDTAFMRPYIYTDPHVGLNEQTTQPRCRIYPNPTRGTLHIITNDEKIRSVSAISALGQPISLRLQGNVVNLDGYPSGVYTLTIITNMNTYQQKIIKL